MRGAHLLITPEMHSYITRRADEIRAIQHKPKPDSDTTIQQDLDCIGVQASTFRFTGKVRYFLRKEPENKQTFYIEDKTVVTIPFETPGRTCKLDEFVERAKFELGDIFPHDFDFAHNLVKLFANEKA